MTPEQSLVGWADARGEVKAIAERFMASTGMGPHEAVDCLRRCVEWLAQDAYKTDLLPRPQSGR